jgi:hypothetical protein
LESSRTINTMVKVHLLFLTVQKLLENLLMVYQMVR